MKTDAIKKLLITLSEAICEIGDPDDLPDFEATVSDACAEFEALETAIAVKDEALLGARDNTRLFMQCDYGDYVENGFALEEIEAALTSTPTGDDSVLEIPLGHGTVAVGVGTNSENGLPVISFWRQAKHPVGETIPGTAGTVVPIKDELVRFRIDDPRGAEAVLLEWIKLVPEKVLVDLDEIMESMYILKTAIADLTQGESLSVAEIEQCREAIVLLDNKLKAHDVPA